MDEGSPTLTLLGVVDDERSSPARLSVVLHLCSRSQRVLRGLYACVTIQEGGRWRDAKGSKEGR